MSATIERHYGMDWLRIAAFGLLILYHIGMFFVPWGWHVKTPRPLDWVALPMLAANSWRLMLLFLVSGYATRALLSRAPSLPRLARERSVRLLAPLIFAMIVIVPPQPWVELTVAHGYARGYLTFWSRDYFDFRQVGDVSLPTWNHMWFVAYLFVYSLLLIALVAMLRQRAGERLQRQFDRPFSGPGLLLLPLAWLLAVRLGLFAGARETHGLFDDGVAHAAYLPAFLFGFALAGAPPVLAAARRYWMPAALLALAAYAAVAAVELRWPGLTPLPAAYRTPFEAARAVQGWAAIVALLGLADRYWNRDHPWRATLTEAVFPFYIVHQTIIVLTGWWLLRLALPPGAAFALILTATVAGCALFYLAGRRLRWLRPLIGLRSALRLDRG